MAVLGPFWYVLPAISCRASRVKAVMCSTKELSTISDSPAKLLMRAVRIILAVIYNNWQLVIWRMNDLGM